MKAHKADPTPGILRRRIPLVQGFYSECTYCGRRINARTTVVLDKRLDEHEAECREKLAAKARAGCQGELFK